MSTAPRILTWRERIGVSSDFPLHMPTEVERAMVAQIADLEAALAEALTSLRPRPASTYELSPPEPALYPAGQVDSEGGHCD